MFQVESSGTLELECVFVSAMVFWGRSSIFHSIPREVSLTATTTTTTQRWSWLIDVMHDALTFNDIWKIFFMKLNWICAPECILKQLGFCGMDGFMFLMFALFMGSWKFACLGWICRVIVLTVGWIIFLSAFIPVHCLLKGHDKLRKKFEVWNVILDFSYNYWSASLWFMAYSFDLSFFDKLLFCLLLFVSLYYVLEMATLNCLVLDNAWILLSKLVRVIYII